MRLVCDQCSAVYTIDDKLVADRDFSVSCKQCGKPIVVKQARPSQRPSSPPPRTRSSLPAPSAVATAMAGAAVASTPSPKPKRQTFEPAGHESWFVWIDGGQRGPHSAGEIAKLIEQGTMDWATQVWREGFKDWRPARRDAVLVTAVAGARGVAGDTTRLNAARSFLAPEDTIVDPRPQLLAAARAAVAAANADLLSSNSETKAIDAREMFPDSEPEAVRAAVPAAQSASFAASSSLPGAVLPDSGAQARVSSGPPGRPNLSPSARPQAWNSPENAAFRAALGLPDSREVQPPKGRIAIPSVQPPPGPTLADHFGTAPNLLRTGPVLEATAEMSLSGSPSQAAGWAAKPLSFLGVALGAFGAGVIAAALIARMLSSPEPTSQAVQVAAPAPKPATVTPVVKKPVQTPLPVPVVTRELPDPDELRREVRRVAPEVKRCIENPTAGVEVDIYIDGPSGRVRDVRVRAAQITPGRVECVIHAVRAMQLAPFKRPELKLTHKFSW